MNRVGSLEIAPVRVRSHIPSLDGARGIAVLLVLLDHATDGGMRLLPVLDFDGAGQFGVYLFFSLSAFLLTYPFWQRPAADLLQWRLWANYFVRRFLRIFPLFVVVLLVMWRVDDAWSLRVVGEHLGLRKGDLHFWTIPVECKFYLLLPLLVIGFGAWKKPRWWKWALVATGGAILFQLGFQTADRAWSLERQVELHRFLPVFLAGAAAGATFSSLQQRGFAAGRFAWGFEILSWLSLATVWVSLPAFNIWGRTFDDEINVGAGAWAVFLFAHLHGTGLMRRLLELAPIRFLGLTSYSAYVWHRLILEQFDGMRLPPAVKLGLFLAAVVGVALVSYLLVERPLFQCRLAKLPRLHPGAGAA